LAHALRITRVEVEPEYVEALIAAEPALARTSRTPGLSERALELLPGLRRHRCDNGSAHGIAAELSDTETPHLLEHVAIELIALSGSPRDLPAETSWDFARDGAHVYRVRIRYDHDLVALGALRESLPIVDWLIAPQAAEKPDVDAAVRRLRDVRVGSR
jgi:hypothetical protein